MASNNIIVQDEDIAIWDTGRFEHMYRVANLMATSSLIPDHLKDQAANCMMICQQAQRWQMDPFAVAQCSYVVGGRMAYEGKLIIAVINARGKLKERLSFEFEGAGQDMKVIVSGTFQNESKPRTVEATWKEGKDQSKHGAKWNQIPDQQLVYYGGRKWGRRHAPELMLGIIADDEIVIEEQMRDITPEKTSSSHPAEHQIEDLDDLVAYHTTNGTTHDSDGVVVENDDETRQPIIKASDLLAAISASQTLDELSTLDINRRQIEATFSPATRKKLNDAVSVQTSILFGAPTDPDTP